MLRDVAVIAEDGMTPFEFGLLCEAFAVDRRVNGVPLLDFAVCAARPGLVRTNLGFGIEVEHGLDRTAQADLVAVPAVSRLVGEPTVSPAVLEALRAAVHRGAQVLSVCSGAFLLGEAGLLDDRACTTHWMYTDDLARRFPRARVQPEVLYVEDGPVVTSAGSAAGLDACLHLWRKAYGSTVAGMVARRMVVPPQRQGGQAQFIRTPVPEPDADTLGPLLDWIVDHLDEPLDVPALARRAVMSERTFARRFRDETGSTPHTWVTTQRVRRAEELLESTGWSVERIADAVGFGSTAVLRHHFVKHRGVSPQQYRASFNADAAGF